MEDDHDGRTRLVDTRDDVKRLEKELTDLKARVLMLEAKQVVQPSAPGDGAYGVGNTTFRFESADLAGSVKTTTYDPFKT